MGRGRKRRLSTEEELQVTEFLETNQSKKPEKKTSLARGFVARTDKQAELVTSIEENEITIAIGPSGTGKTFAAVATALSLLNQGYENIVLVKSVTTLPGEEIGFLKGSLSEKLDPFMMSFTWNIDKVGGKDTSKKLMEQNIIQVLPLAYIRGLSIDNSVVIIDESQNLTRHAFKSIMTRIGTNSKYVFLGDIEQIDRKKQSESCLAEVLDIFRDEDYIGTVEFLDEDCVRNPLIPKILDKLREKGI